MFEFKGDEKTLLVNANDLISIQIFNTLDNVQCLDVTTRKHSHTICYSCHGKAIKDFNFILKIAGKEKFHIATNMQHTAMLKDEISAVEISPFMEDKYSVKVWVCGIKTLMTFTKKESAEREYNEISKLFDIVKPD